MNSYNWQRSQKNQKYLRSFILYYWCADAQPYLNKSQKSLSNNSFFFSDFHIVFNFFSYKVGYYIVHQSNILASHTFLLLMRPGPAKNCCQMCQCVQCVGGDPKWPHLTQRGKKKVKSRVFCKKARTSKTNSSLPPKLM